MATKVGRNAPCPCGSGKKFKRCCADRHDTAQRPTPTPSLPEPAPSKAARQRVFMRAIDGILAHSRQLLTRGGAAEELLRDARERASIDNAEVAGTYATLIGRLLVFAPRVFGGDAHERWRRLILPRLTPEGRRLLEHFHASPPRLWLRSTPWKDVDEVTAVSRATSRSLATTMYLVLSPADRNGKAPWLFGWRFVTETETVLVNVFDVDAALADDLVAHIGGCEQSGDERADPWNIALDVAELILESEISAAARPRPASERDVEREEAWRKHVARDAHNRALNSAVRALLGPRPATRATARANAPRLVELVAAAVASAQPSLAWAARLGVEVTLRAEEVLGVLGFDAHGQAPGLDRDALSRHPLALLAPDPEGAGLPAADPRLPIGAAAAIATGPQVKALNKALTAYEREVRFGHLIRELGRRLAGRGSPDWRYELLQAGRLELLRDAVDDLPLSHLGLPRATANRVTAALGADAGEARVGDLPSNAAGLWRLRGVGDKTRGALVDAVEELFNSWRWKRAGLDQASFTAARPAGDDARDTLSAGLDQLDALFG